MSNNFDFRFMLNSIPQMLVYLPVTVWLAVASMILGTLIGLVVALVKIYKVPVFRQLAALYVSFIRGTPLLVQLYLVYYGLPKLLINLSQSISLLRGMDAINQISPEFFALTAFSINLGAYLSETIRSAIQSVDRGQFEAALSIGLRPAQIMLQIVLPQAALVALPNLGNSLIGMVKDTSFAFMIMVLDIMGEANIIGARSLRFFEVYAGVSLIYWVTCIILGQVIGLLEQRLRLNERSIAV